MILFCEDGGTGIRTELKILRTIVHAGSTPALRIARRCDLMYQ